MVYDDYENEQRPGPKVKSKYVGPDHEEVAKEISRFKVYGGLIKTLPDQVTTIKNCFGAKYSIYEELRFSRFWVRELF